jgi:hypothetical protein
MGFRNPITTAEGVDTGDSPTGPGVRMYQERTDNPARGVAEWRSGVAGDAPATVTLISFQFNDPDFGIRTIGRQFRHYGGQSNGVDAPTLQLNVREAAAGGYEAAALIDKPLALALPGGQTTYLEVSSFRVGWDQWTTAGYAKLSFTRQPDGMVEVAGTVLYTGVFGATVDICNISGPYLPKYGHAPLEANVQDTFRFAEARTDGSLRLRGALPTAGQFVMIAGRYHGQDYRP